MTEHTAGPWILGQPGGPQGPFWCIVNSAGRVVAAQVLNESDGQLMAAAPDLLSACEAALRPNDEPCRADHHGYCQTHNLGPIEDCWVGKLRAAIAKAKGSDG